MRARVMRLPSQSTPKWVPITLSGLTSKGTTPLKLTYLKSWSGKSLNETVHISPGRSQVNLHLPEELQAVNGASGKFSVALLSIEDGNGCIKKLSALTYEVDINRERVRW